MVINMESRLERYRQRRKLIYIGILKLIILVCLSIVLSILIIKVNKTIIELNVLDNTNLFTLDFTNKAFSFLGKQYIININ